MPRWDDPETVAFFRDRPPDHRLVALVEAGALPCGARVLDLGCAGGRNAAYLTDLDVEVQAVDASPAMVAATRARLARTLGPDEAARRVRVGTIERLQAPDASFDLVLALGVLQHAGSEVAFEAAVREVARVLRPGGSVLVAHFAPSSRPGGRVLHRVPGTRHAYRGWEADDPDVVLVLHEPETLDAAFAAAGLAPVTASDRVERPPGDGGLRVTVNAHYARPVA